MSAGGEKGRDFYTVLGLKKECTNAELRNAYKQLALRWHPDRCSASGNSKFVDEAKIKFQSIQEAYSVLSDGNKRFLYDVGVYDNNEDDDENGMSEFLNEMVTMMSQTEPNGTGEETFEELQELFREMFQDDLEALTASSTNNVCASCSTCAYASFGESSNGSNKRSSTEMNGLDGSYAFHSHFPSFSMGAEQEPSAAGKVGRGNGGRKRHGRKQKASSGHDVSYNDYSVSGISAS